MTCPKCNKQNEGGNFCGNCAEPLKEKCPECGGMDRIGRTFCENNLKKAKKDLYAYLEENHDGKYLGICFSLLFICLIAGLFSLPSTGSMIVVVAWAIGVAFVSFVLPFMHMIITRPDSEKKFLRLHPEYAEILEKAKSAEMKTEERKEK